MGERQKTFGTMKMMSIVGSVSLGVKKELYETVALPQVTCGMDTGGMKLDERHVIDAMDIQCLRCMWKNEGTSK